MGREVNTTSQPARAAMLAAEVAPSAVQRATAAASRSCTTTWWLVFLMMLRHMGPPMLPTPMKPIFMW